LIDKFADNNGVTIQYLVVNQDKGGTPVIFIPGAMVSAEDFYGDVKDYLDIYSVTVSIRGLGKSDAPQSGYSKEHLVSDVEAVVISEGIGKFYICGHSFGASIASAYSVKYPDKVLGLILGDYPPVYPAYSDSWAKRVRESNLEVNENLLNGLLKESKHENFADQLAQCPFSVLEMKGEGGGSLLTLEHITKMLEAMPNASLKLIPNAGHEIFIENPEAVFVEVKGFVRKGIV
jgi:pimeloyl-ACP methyl ester carboxylesterase